MGEGDLEKLLSDHLAVQNRIAKLLESGNNHRVLHANHLDPAVSREIVPFRYDRDGAFMYFVKMRAVMEAELTGGIVGWEYMSYKLPFEDRRRDLGAIPRGLLLRDHEVAEQGIHDVLQTGDNQYLRLDSYVNPRFISEVVPFDKPYGRFKYLIRSRKAIEFVLASGSVPKDFLPYIAPKYLQRFAV